MLLTISLTSDQEAQLRSAAAAEGIEPPELIQKLVSESLPARMRQTSAHVSADARRRAAMELLQSWLDEEATSDPDEIRQAEQELEEFKRAMNASRTDSADTAVFP